ncbi:MAG: class I SAM-dependent methyltransferase [Chloroflexi bacterium]|nr:MAG: class I SAM-dependent methyltransferase [Chloroflexota bacterium]
MKTTEVFSSKAEKYARYRWEYASQAIQTIFDVAQITSQSSVADIGAGTGILTRHFIGKVQQIFAIEPNLEMRQLAVQALGSYSACHIIDGRAEATTLADGSVDLITVAQAIHWFEPQPTKTEFLRILKPGGWLAILRNDGTNAEIGKALGKVYPSETDTLPLMKGRGTPISFYYGGDSYLKQTFDFTVQQDWEKFLGALSSASYAPDEGSPLYASFERAAKQVFDGFSTDGLMVSPAVTELCLGQIKT